MNYGKVEEPSSSRNRSPKYGEISCYIRDPDGYIIEVGQSTDLTYG
jgi:catechol 2,3-dioxygenase-like lactoylglutathione lyase family enzyme